MSRNLRAIKYEVLGDRVGKFFPNLQLFSELKNFLDTYNPEFLHDDAAARAHACAQPCPPHNGGVWGAEHKGPALDSPLGASGTGHVGASLSAEFRKCTDIDLRLFELAINH